MVTPEKFKYSLLLITNDGKRHDITDLVTGLTWEEGENELASRISFTAKNEKTKKGRLSKLAKPGCYLYLMYRKGGGKGKEAARARIIEWNPSARMTQENLGVKAYDMLYDLQESSDDVYFPSGKKTKSVLGEIFGKWKIPLGKYNGADRRHAKIVYRNRKLGTIITDVLEEAKKKGGDESFLRAAKGKVQVLAYGSNDPVYAFILRDNIISMSHKVTTAGMVTRVKVIGEEKKSGRSPVLATVDGKTKYGIRQKIYARGKDESMADAKEAARDILDDDGKPGETISVRAPDIPMVRKGDAVYVRATTLDGTYWVKGITHNIDDMTMDMDLKEPKKKKNGK